MDFAQASVNAAAKYAAPSGLLAWMADVHLFGVDIELAGAITIGLIAGAVIKASLFYQADAGWVRARRDLVVSGMAGMANFLIAAVVVFVGDFMLLAAVERTMPDLIGGAVGMVVGFRGNDNVRWFAKKYLGIDVQADEYRAPPALKEAYEERADRPVPKDMAEMAREIDKKGNGNGTDS